MTVYVCIWWLWCRSWTCTVHQRSVTCLDQWVHRHQTDSDSLKNDTTTGMIPPVTVNTHVIVQVMKTFLYNAAFHGLTLLSLCFYLLSCQVPLLWLYGTYVTLILTYIDLIDWSHRTHRQLVDWQLVVWQLVDWLSVKAVVLLVQDAGRSSNGTFISHCSLNSSVIQL